MIPLQGEEDISTSEAAEETAESEDPTTFSTQLKKLLDGVAEGEMIPSKLSFNFPEVQGATGEGAPPGIQGVVERQEFLF